MNITPVAHIESGFKEKFGIPRQSGLVSGTVAYIVFEKEYKNPDYIKGIEDYSHLWLIWNFSKSNPSSVKPLVTPPRLGGNVKKGVFATRSPFRPNGMGLSSVRLEQVIYDDKRGPVLVVSGADLLDGTPIYDIKPYLAYTDSHGDARCGFAEEHKDDSIRVEFPDEILKKLPQNIQAAVTNILAQDPRAAYNKRSDYVYGLRYMDYDIRFTADDELLRVVDVVDTKSAEYSKVK